MGDQGEGRCWYMFMSFITFDQSNDTDIKIWINFIHRLIFSHAMTALTLPAPC